MVSVHPIYDDVLLACAKQCSAFAQDNCKELNHSNEILQLSLDCADLCRQTSVLWRNRSEKTKNTALFCIRACDSVMRHLTISMSVHTHSLVESCLRARQRCAEIVEQSWCNKHATHSQTATVCYGIALPASIYQA